jgi:phenolic acid decarboxylase
VTGGDGSLDYPLTRARVSSIIYFSVTKCHQNDLGPPAETARGREPAWPGAVMPHFELSTYRLGMSGRNPAWNLRGGLQKSINDTNKRARETEMKLYFNLAFA